MIHESKWILQSKTSLRIMKGEAMKRRTTFSANRKVKGNWYNRRSHQSCSIKKLFLKFCNIYKKTPVLESLFNKVAGLLTWPATLLKRDCNISVLPVNAVNILIIPILKNICEWLPLIQHDCLTFPVWKRPLRTKD